MNRFLDGQVGEVSNRDKIGRRMEMIGDSKEGLFMLSVGPVFHRREGCDEE